MDVVSVLGEISEALSDALGVPVFYGWIPDDDDGSLDAIVVLHDFALGRAEHVMGEAEPAFTPFGITVHARAATQEAARSVCTSAYTALLSMGYLALSPPVSLGRDEVGRFECVASVEAYTIR